MHITKVTAHNLKGRSLDRALQPLNIIAGPNFAGKTSILDAVRLTLLGYIPDVGKKNASTFELSSGAQMWTQVEIENELYRRMWTASGKSVSLESSKNLESDPLLTPLLDTETYFGLSEAARVNYIFNAVPMPPTCTRDGIMAGLNQISFGEQHSELVEAAKAAVLTVCTRAFGPEKAPTPIPEALTALVDGELKTLFSEWNLKAKDSIGAVRTLTDIMTRENECTAEAIAQARESVTCARDASKTASARVQKLLTSQENAASYRTLRRGLQETVNGDVEPFRQELAKEVAIQEDLDAKANSTKAEYEASIEKPVPTRIARPDSGAVQNIKAQADFQRERQTTVTLRLQSIDAMECCPTCKAKKKGWKDAMRESTQAELDEVNRKLEGLDNGLAVEQAKWQDEIKHYDEVEAERSRRDTVAGRLFDLDRAAASAALIQRAVVKTWEDKLHRLQTRIEDARKQLASLEEAAPAPTPEEITAAKAEEDRATITQTTAENRLQMAQQLQQDLLRARQAAQKHEQAAAYVLVIKAIGGNLRERKAEAVREAFGSLLELANGIVGDLLLTPLAYDADRNELGRRNSSGTWIGHRAFSGTEKALAYVALAAALSSKAPLRVLMLDELARLTPDLQVDVLTRLEAAVAREIIDQVLVVIPTDNPGDLSDMEDIRESWNIIEVTA